MYKQSKACKVLIQKLKDFDKKYPTGLHEMFLDWLNVVEYGQSKPGRTLNNWLEPNGNSISRKDNHASMGRHWAHSVNFDKLNYIDDTNHCYAYDESGLHPCMHLACRAVFQYIRDEKGIKHNEDFK